MSNNTEQSFWRTLPGILTGIAGVITAITGCIVAINSFSSGGDQPQSVGSGTVCAYDGRSDEVTITNKIQAEAEAVNKEDISVIRNIFASNAVIRYDGESGSEEWNDPVSFYKSKFDEADFVTAVHFNIQPDDKGLTSDTAWFISGSSGKMVFPDDSSIEYHNEVGSDRWTLKKIMLVVGLL